MNNHREQLLRSQIIARRMWDGGVFVGCVPVSTYSVPMMDIIDTFKGAYFNARMTTINDRSISEWSQSSG